MSLPLPSRSPWSMMTWLPKPPESSSWIGDDAVGDRVDRGAAAGREVDAHVHAGAAAAGSGALAEAGADRHGVRERPADRPVRVAERVAVVAGAVLQAQHLGPRGDRVLVARGRGGRRRRRRRPCSGCPAACAWSAAGGGCVSTPSSAAGVERVGRHRHADGEGAGEDHGADREDARADAAGAAGAARAGREAAVVATATRAPLGSLRAALRCDFSMARMRRAAEPDCGLRSSSRCSRREPALRRRDRAASVRREIRGRAWWCEQGCRSPTGCRSRGVRERWVRRPLAPGRVGSG